MEPPPRCLSSGPSPAKPPVVDFRQRAAGPAGGFLLPRRSPQEPRRRERRTALWVRPAARRTPTFHQVMQFTLAGMSAQPSITQQLESARTPIVHTKLALSTAVLELTAFATNRREEGRVDNVIVTVRPLSAGRVWAEPLVLLKTRRTAITRNSGRVGTVYLTETRSAHP